MASVPYITHNERLYVMGANEDYGMCGEFKNVTQVLNFVDELKDVFKIIRYDMETNTGEDITEKVAYAYIERYCRDLDEDSDVPPYIANSEVWDEHLKALEAQLAEEARFGTYEEQHRLRLSDVI